MSDTVAKHTSKQVRKLLLGSAVGSMAAACMGILLLINWHSTNLRSDWHDLVVKATSHPNMVKLDI